MQGSRKDDAKLTARAALVNTIVNLLVMAVGAITVPIVTRIMPVEDVGIANTFFSTRNTLMIIISLATHSYVNRGMLDFKQEKQELLRTLIGVCFVMTLLVGTICYPFRQFMSSLLSLDDFLSIWLFASALALAFYYTAYAYCAFHNQILKSSGILLLNGIAAPALSIVLVLAHDSKIYMWRVLGLDSSLVIVSVALISWLILPYIFRREKLLSIRGRKKYIRSMLSFSIPLIPYQLSQMVLTQCDLIMISSLVGAQESGIYSMGHLVGYMAAVALTQLFGAWSPWVMRRLEAEECDTVRNYSKYVALACMLFAAGLITIAPELVRIFLPADYADCIYIVPVLVAAMFLSSIYTFFCDLMYYHKKTGWIAGISTMAAVVNIVLNLVLIPRVGYMAAAYTTFFSYLLMLVCGCVYTFKLNVTHIYDLRFVLAVCIVIPLYAWATMSFLSGVIPRYGLLVILVVALFLIYRKDAMMILREIR